MARGAAPGIAGRMMSGRVIGIALVLFLVFIAGAMIGGGYTRDAGVAKQRAQITACLPIGDAAQLAACLDGAQP